MSKVIISDTSCIITLSNIGELEILKKLYGRVFITKHVVDEFQLSLPEWFVVENPKNQDLYLSLLPIIGNGESSAIALAYEKKDSLLILDDHKARKIAQKYEIVFTGTLGVILSAKSQGIITEIKPIIERIKKTNFRLSDEVIEKILIQSGEYIRH